jgi:hypothetical protein
LFDPVLLGSGSEQGPIGVEDFFDVGPKAFNLPTHPFGADATLRLDLPALLESLEQLPSGPLEINLVGNESE